LGFYYLNQDLPRPAPNGAGRGKTSSPGPLFEKRGPGDQDFNKKNILNKNILFIKN
jgi:hypothetical protein